MEENQTNQNLNQQPVQPVQSQPEQVQQPVQWQPNQQLVTDQQQVQQQSVQWQTQNVEQPSVSMQIQELLVKQQQYQQQYNQLVDYVKKTPNLPLDQVNQIKVQLDQLNALFVQWKQQLQALWYTQIQVNKPTEVKKWPRNNFSFKTLAIWCGVVLLLIMIGFWVTLTSLIKNPDALLWIWVDAWVAKTLLQVFSALLFWSIIILMLWVIIANIYRLITVKNQSKKRYIWWLIWWIFWAAWIWAIMWLVLWWTNKIIVEKSEINWPIIQPYLVGVVQKDRDEFNFPYDENWNLWEKYPLIAPAEFAFRLNSSKLLQEQSKNLWPNTTIQSLTIICGNQQNQRLELSWDIDQLETDETIAFKWRCLYGEKGKYVYSLEIVYKNDLKGEILKKNIEFNNSPLDFKSEVLVKLNTTSSSSSNSKSSRIKPTNWEFLLWKAPAKLTIDTTQVFIDFSLSNYNEVWDMDWDLNNDRENQVTFDYSYAIPQVYHPTFKFPDLYDFIYTFPVRVTPSDVPVCQIKVENFKWTKKYNIFSDFVDPADAAKISSYNYTIRNIKSTNPHEIMKDQPQEINYTFPEQWTYVVVLDYVTVDWKQWRCESEPIQMEKEKFDVQYAILELNSETWKFKELCNSKGTTNKKCTEISLDSVPQTYQLQIKSVSPYSKTLRKVVALNDNSLLNENHTYTFDIPDEGIYELKITTSDVGRWMDEEEIIINFTAKKPDIVWLITITSSEKDETQRKTVTEWFEPLTVILDASKTEVNIEGDEIIYFTWNFGDGEIKRNIQNWVVAHTYNYDYARENWIFTPEVSIKTRSWIEKTIYGPTLNVKKWLISIDIDPISHPSRQAPVWTEVEFSAGFDWLPEKMTWDFGDGSIPVSCLWRNCTNIKHTFEEAGLFSIKLSLEFDAVQQVDGTIDFKVY